jgi:hypothetical protein
MPSDWTELTKMTQNRPFNVTRVKLANTDISIEGEFELPSLARLPYEDQVFVAQFIRHHGSIKQMEASFGVSYPTIKNRLNRIAGQLQLVQVTPLSKKEAILAQLETGEITPAEAIERMKQ